MTSQPIDRNVKTFFRADGLRVKWRRSPVRIHFPRESAI